MKRLRQDFALPKLALFLIVLQAVGCTTVPVGKFDAVAESSQSILSGTSDTYARIEKLQRQFSVVTVGSAPLTTSSFTPNIEGLDFELKPALRSREAALEVLVKYSLALQALAKKDFEGEVDKASESLRGSLKSFAATAAPDDKSGQMTSGILATAVDAIGRGISQKKRLAALKETMDSAQPHIETLSQLIVSNNEKIKLAVGMMLDRIVAHENAVRPETGKGRIEFDSKVALQIAEAKEIQDALDALSTAMTKVPTAHKEIRKMLDEEPTGLKTLSELIAEAERLNKFYRNVK